MTSNSNTIIGAVIGDVIGSVFEWNNIKTTDFDLFNPACDFTDDSVLTIAVADCILNKKPFARNIWEYGRKYHGRGYGGSFGLWLKEDSLKPYGSLGYEVLDFLLCFSLSCQKYGRCRCLSTFNSFGMIMCHFR